MVPVATACADATDFTTQDGKLKLAPHVYQNAVETFSFLIPPATPDGSYVTVTNFDAVTIGPAGLYLVSWDIHGYIALPGPNLGTPLNGGVMGGLSVNGQFRPETETMIATINEGSTSTSFPALGQEATGSGTIPMVMAANAIIRMMGAQEGNGSNVCRIISDDRGRCRLSAVRIGGV